MRATYRPGLRVPAEWLGHDAAKPGYEQVPIPALDEDEATMAVAAARAVLAAAGVEASTLGSVSTNLQAPLAQIVSQALGVASGTDAGLRLTVQAPRAGQAPSRDPARGAFATAEVDGGAARELSVGPPARTLAREAFDKLAKWEREAPLRTTMGAYISLSSWERSVPSRYRLEAGRCGANHIEYPARPRCTTCGKPTQATALPRAGRLETFTVVAKGAGPSEFEPLQDVDGEYAVGIARFGDVRVAGMFTESALEGIRIGDAVEPVFRRLYAQDGLWRYGLKFRQIPK